MALKLYSDSDIQDIADAIRGKNGTQNTYKVSQMAAAITAIPTGGGSDTPYLYVDKTGALIVPSGATSYVSDGLMIHLDGIDNTGSGHSSSATTWADLSGNGHDATVGDSYRVVNDKYVQITRTLELAQALTYANVKHIEMIIKLDGTSSTQCVAPWTNDNAVYIKSAKLQYSSSASKGITLSTDICALSFSTTAGLTTAYLDGTEPTLDSSTTGTWGSTAFGTRLFGYNSETAYVMAGRIYSVRMYNRVLSPVEIIDNWLIDKKRFGL